MPQFVILAGASGAGRSSAAAVLEDLGWFVIDNLPPGLLAKVAELVSGPAPETERVALVVGRGGREALAETPRAVQSLRASGARVRLLFLDASDEVLIRRFEGTRRRHPVAQANESVASAIVAERRLLDPLRDLADVVLDTSDLSVHDLRRRLGELFGREGATDELIVNVVSFGYKHGVPLDADLVLDCRFLANPHWVDELRPASGLEEPVRQYVLGQDRAQQFLTRLDGLLDVLLAGYLDEGKPYLSLAVGCTGGRHRSVVMAEEIARLLERRGLPTTVSHRDIDR